MFKFDEVRSLNFNSELSDTRKKVNDAIQSDMDIREPVKWPDTIVPFKQLGKICLSDVASYFEAYFDKDIIAFNTRSTLNEMSSFVFCSMSTGHTLPEDAVTGIRHFLMENDYINRMVQNPYNAPIPQHIKDACIDLLNRVISE